MKRVLPVLLATVMMVAAVMSVSAATILYGDVTGDAKINNRDLAMLQQHINGWEVTVDLAAADVNDDGRVNNRDLAMLQQYINGWDVKLGPEEPVVPPAELPEVGYDLDSRGRILVQAIAQEGNVVTVTLANTSDKWITEETSYVEYTCTDAEGNVLTLDDKYYGVVFFGMLEVGETTTRTITLPEGTAKLEFGACRIVYWSQWMK